MRTVVVSVAIQLCVLLGCLPPSAAAAATSGADAPAAVFAHLTTADGLPQSTVYATLQDSQGFVWFGTEDGLVRYDGHRLFRYGYRRGAADGLPGNFRRSWKTFTMTSGSPWRTAALPSGTAAPMDSRYTGMTRRVPTLFPAMSSAHCLSMAAAASG